MDLKFMEMPHLDKTQSILPLTGHWVPLWLMFFLHLFAGGRGQNTRPSGDQTQVRLMRVGQVITVKRKELKSKNKTHEKPN